MQRNKIPSKFEKWSKLWDRWIYKLNENSLNPVAVCLNYPLSLAEIDSVVVGVDSKEQLEMILSACSAKEMLQDWSFMINNDQKLINPSNWSEM